MILHLVVAIATAGLTWMLGWWGVAIVAVVAGFVYRADGGRAWWVALGALEGWALLLLFNLARGPLMHVASTLGGAMSIPGPALMVLTLLFPALLAWSGAIVAAAVGRAVAPSKAPVR